MHRARGAPLQQVQGRDVLLHYLSEGGLEAWWSQARLQEEGPVSDKLPGNATSGSNDFGCEHRAGVRQRRVHRARGAHVHCHVDGLQSCEVLLRCVPKGSQKGPPSNVPGPMESAGAWGGGPSYGATDDWRCNRADG